MTIVELLISIISSATVSNIVIARGLGVESAFLASKDTKNIEKLGLLVTLSIFISSAIVYPIDLFLDANGLTFISILFYEVIIKIVCHIVNDIFNKTDKDMYLIMSINAAVLGAVLSVTTAESFFETLAISLGSGLAYYLSLKLIAGVRTRIDNKEVAPAFKGYPIELIAVGIICLALYAFK